jgi:ArsR family transcriptional regulator
MSIDIHEALKALDNPARLPILTRLQETITHNPSKRSSPKKSGSA